MKELKTAVSRGQDPEKIHNSGEYLKMLAELHELEAKIINLFFKFAETGSLEDLEALKKTMEPHFDNWRKMMRTQMGIINRFDGLKRTLCADVLFLTTASACETCDKIENEMRMEAEECTK